MHSIKVKPISLLLLATFAVASHAQNLELEYVNKWNLGIQDVEVANVNLLNLPNGDSISIDDSNDIFLMRANKLGAVLGSRRIDSPGGGSDKILFSALDGSEIVVGYSKILSTLSGQPRIAKYNAALELIWDKPLPTEIFEAGRLMVDATGYYAVGKSASRHSLFKFNKSGDLLFRRDMDGLGLFDAAGSTVVGAIKEGGGYGVYRIHKSTGALLARFQTVGENYNSIATHSSGAIYLVGRMNSGNTTLRTRITPSGTVSSVFYSEGSTPKIIARLNGNEVYLDRNNGQSVSIEKRNIVTDELVHSHTVPGSYEGFAVSRSGERVAVISTTEDGKRARIYANDFSTLLENLEAPSVDFEIYASSYPNSFLLRARGEKLIHLTPQGGWESTYSPTGYAIQAPRASVTDATGARYVVTLPSNIPDNAFLLTKFSPTGQVLWSKKFDPVATTEFYDIKMTVGTDGAISIVTETNIGNVAQVYKFNGAGYRLYRKDIPMACDGVASGPNGITYLVGRADNQVAGEIIALAANGSEIWRVSNAAWGPGQSITVLPNGDLAIGSPLGQNGQLRVHNSVGGIKWLRTLPYDNNLTARRVKLVQQADGKVLVGVIHTGMELSNGVFKIWRLDPAARSTLMSAFVRVELPVDYLPSRSGYEPVMASAPNGDAVVSTVEIYPEPYNPVAYLFDGSTGQRKWRKPLEITEPWLLGMGTDPQGGVVLGYRQALNGQAGYGFTKLSATGDLVQRVDLVGDPAIFSYGPDHRVWFGAGEYVQNRGRTLAARQYRPN